MFTGIIVEDEALSRENLELLIEEYCPDISIVQTFSNAEEAIRFLDRQPVDVVLLDIHLGNRNGLDVAREIEHHRCHIVFVTAYDKYAVKAFKLNCIDYIMKPVDIDELLLLNNKLVDIYAVRDRKDQQLREMQQGIEKVRSLIEKTLSRNKLPIQFAWGVKMVDLSEICYLQSDNNYTWFHFTNGDKHIVARTIKKYEELLTDMNFFRVHVSYLVNLDHVMEYHLKDAYIVLTDGSNIPVSQRRLVELKKLTNRLNEC